MFFSVSCHVVFPLSRRCTQQLINIGIGLRGLCCMPPVIKKLNTTATLSLLIRVSVGGSQVLCFISCSFTAKKKELMTRGW
ncbi:hypothetical protein QBC38DRAFT_476224 [Podospora fimiseda]|uniref:Uncharacterized protein n=1 Tax=Podospora fimiseda TaxID=252190 RepID=A0AAN7BQZ3_9PEZI|nr:hypothetical protein QBC38DRAFT_476224 [Podospora fimiseda]